MAQILEGTWDEIAAHASQLRKYDRLTLIIPTDNGAEPVQNGDGDSLADALKDYIGSFHFGDANLSEDSSKKFAQMLMEKHKKEQE
jgi:hypothetical protein